MLEAIRPALVIARREIRDQFRDWRIIFPVFFLTFAFPFIMNWTARQMLDFVAEYGATLIGERMVPFLLMITGFFPISFTLVIALESFVGEKERGSIEPLLNSPLKDWQLYLGKLISSTLPALLASYLGMSVYMTGLVMNHIALPPLGVLAQIFALTSVQAIMMVSGAVVVSSQATSVRAANLLSAFIVIPSAFLIQWEALVMFWGNNDTLWWVVGGLLVLTVLLMRVGLAHFQREELLGHEIDVLNLRWGWKVFSTAFTGGARSVRQWYRQSVFPALKPLAWPVLFTCGVVVAGYFVGVSLVDRFPLLIPQELLEGSSERLSETLSVLPGVAGGTVALVWWQNFRVLLLAMALGAVTFGVLGVFPLMGTMAVAGYLLTVLANSGFSVWKLIVTLVLPHGVLEIPLAILATAAMLRAGAILATPTTGQTVGEAWLTALAGWCKIMVGIVAPLLVIASVIEVYLTPRLAMWLLAGL